MILQYLTHTLEDENTLFKEVKTAFSIQNLFFRHKLESSCSNKFRERQTLEWFLHIIYYLITMN